MVRAVPLLLLALLAACREDAPPPPEAERDPAVEQALNDPLMTDPDLSSRNEAAAALTVRTDGALPVFTASQEDIAAARAEAAVMVGGADKLRAVPKSIGRTAQLAGSHGPADHLATLAGKSSCRAKLTDSAIWAARLPAAIPVYPRGATQAATGGEGKGCRVAAIVFTTPVPPAEVLAFYWRRAEAAGLAPRRLSAGDSDVLQGQGGRLAFDLRIQQDGSLTRVELATVTG